MNRLMIVLCALFLLTGCATSDPSTPAADPTRDPLVLPTLTPTDEGSTPDDASDDVASGGTSWNPVAEAVILQYDEGGGFRMAPSGTQLPLFTLYGDGTVVWSQESEKPSAGFEREVFVGKLTPEEMSALLDFVEASGIWEIESVRDEMIADAPTSYLIASFNDKQREISVYPAGSPEAPAPFATVRDRLLSERPTNSARYDADSFLFQAQQINNLGELTEDQAVLYEWWPFESLPLEQYTSTQVEFTGEQATAIADFVRDNGKIVKYQTQLYQISLFGEAPRPVQ